MSSIQSHVKERDKTGKGRDIKATSGSAEEALSKAQGAECRPDNSPESQLPGNHKCFKQPVAIVHGESAVCGCR